MDASMKHPYIYDQAAREWEEPEDDEVPDTCEDCGQKKCVCAQLDDLNQ